VAANIRFRDTYPFTISRDGGRFLVDQPGESLHRIFAVPLRGEPRLSALLPLTGVPLAIDSDSAGHLYVDQSERPTEIRRRAHCPAGKTMVQRIPLSPAFEDRTILPLRRDRFLFASSTRGISRLMLIEPGKESRPFLESRLESSPPFSWL